MREKYLKICSFAKSRNMQIVLFVLVSFTATFYAFYGCSFAFFLGYIFFSELNLIIQKFSIIFFLLNYPLLLERYLNFFGVTILCVLYPFLLLFLFTKTLEKLKKSKSIFIDLFIFILLFCVADLVFFTFELTVKAFY
ncbi:MAG: hypothetical protein SPH77_06935 [Campylobacter sp.]|uniref:hypothetical protein n=1 Tax=Campylobacter sp. TaxID=205 RepID=UPI002A909F0B|nr:hypothetical protein [Campylobacter sp.]MDY6188549.1 hypothetical protein [Campylobacter sp.]